MKNASEKYGYDSCFPTRFRELMGLNKVSQTVMAELCGVQRQSISLWYNGDTRPDIISLGKIAQYFGVSTDYLLGLTDYKTTDRATKELCNTLGLSEEAIEILSANTSSLLANKWRDIFLNDEQIDSKVENLMKSHSEEAVFVINRLLEEYLNTIMSTFFQDAPSTQVSLLSHLRQLYFYIDTLDFSFVKLDSDGHSTLFFDRNSTLMPVGGKYIGMPINAKELLINSAIGEINTRLHNIKHEKLGE